jgi:hypothetical protein
MATANIPPFGCDVRNASAEQKREFLYLLTKYEDKDINTWSGHFHYYGIDATGEAQGIMNCKDNFQEEFFTRIIPIEQGIAILKGEEEPKDDGWISVKDRLPEKNCSVIVFDPNNPFDSGICVARYSEYNPCFYINGSDTIHPSHWMPLPNPPKQ